MRERSSVVNGLSFYTPDVVNGEAMTAYAHCIEITDSHYASVVDDEPDGVYVLTPAGEQELSSLDLKPLMQTEQEIKAVNGR